jgi:2,4-dienoyl-CoA reductase-like NADH-dependent reductase (Old Yellow Enzyme family)
MINRTVDPFAPASLGPVTLPNRFVKAATFEGMAIDNSMSDHIVDYHRAHVRGGVGLTTLAYCAISPDGQGAPNEIVVRPEILENLKSFTDMVHQEGAKASIQLGHAGPVGAGSGRPGLAASRVLAKQAMRYTTPATSADLALVIDQFASAAIIAVDAGFDCIELHFGHGYLVSNFLSPKLNKRDDDWGGSLDNRARLAREVAGAVYAAVNGRAAITAKLNLSDGVPGGFWVDESVQVASMLEADRTLDALELSGGSSFENPMYLFRGEAPIAEMSAIFPKPIRLGFKLTAKRFMPEYPFEEAFFLPYARQVRDAVSMPLILLGGINRLETVNHALDEGFEFVAMGRALLREPALVNRWKSGDTQDGLCVHCNKCMPSIYQGTHCVLVDPEERPGHKSWVDRQR